MKKYKLIKSDVRGLYRIKALRDFGDVKKGDIGGYVESERNLSHGGICWIYGLVLVCGDACVYGHARVTKPVVNVALPVFHITITDNHVAVGCELLRISHLEADGKRAAKKHGWDKTRIAKYRAIIKAMLALKEWPHEA